MLRFFDESNCFRNFSISDIVSNKAILFEVLRSNLEHDLKMEIQYNQNIKYEFEIQK